VCLRGFFVRSSAEVALRLAVQTEKKLNKGGKPLGSLQILEITKRDQEQMLCTKMSLMPLDFTRQPNIIFFYAASAFAKDWRMHHQAGDLRPEHEEKNMNSNSLVRETFDGVLSPYLMAMAIEDEIAAEVTARAMGWVPVEGEDGTRVWVRLKDIGVDGAPYCDTALEVIRTYTH
jgi:hypothetical protein